MTGRQETWMAKPEVANCPRGLECLAVLNQLLVAQKVELLELTVGLEQEHRFRVRNGSGQMVYNAIEDSDFCARSCFGSMRSFEMRIVDRSQNEVLHISRPFRCNTLCCCIPSCLSMIEVSAPPGQVIGTVKQVCTWFRPRYCVKNMVGNVVFNLVGPCCVFECCNDITLKIVNVNGEEIGQITKHWSGLARELFTDNEYYSVTFPLNLDLRLKALLFSAVFLIDIVQFEQKSGS